MTAEAEISYSHGTADSDSDVEDKKGHSKLLSAISRLDRKQRVKPPSRKESSVQVSEFHLTKQKKSHANNAVNLTELATVLGKGASSHVAISKKLKSVQKKVKPLAKPLEKIVADKVKRQTGFTNAKELLNRWDTVVLNNKVADQLEFPLMKKKMTIFRETNIFATAANPKTELEKEVYTALKESGHMNHEEENEEKQDAFPKTLKEVLEQRRESARLKAQATQQQIKTWRQNKSKSKKFHRILKKEKLRNQIKEFELLKETNPEEALRRLDQLERSRAQERASLRHKNTGQWAKNKAIRAKYDRECRQVLAEQLSISRELSQKVQMEDDSSDSEGETSDFTVAPDLAPENPLEGDISQFVSGYRKYWEQKQAPLKGQTQIVKKPENKSNGIGIEEGNKSRVATPKKRKLQVVTLDDEVVESSSKDSFPILKQSDVVIKSSKVKRMNEIDKNKSKKLKQKLQDEVESSLNLKSALHKTDKLKSPKLKSPKLKILNSSWTVTDVENHENENAKLKNKHKKAKNVIDIVDLFDSVESEQEKVLTKSLKRLKKLSEEDEKQANEEKKSTNDTKTAIMRKNKLKKPKSSSSNTGDRVVLSLRNNSAVIKPVSHPLEEQAVGVEEASSSLDEMQSLLNLSEKGVKEQSMLSSDIDPTKFLKARPLKSYKAELVMTGLEDLDDMEQEEEDKNKVALAEAFADDDVVDAFRNEKEGAIEESKPKDLDLTLPGWGEWGGTGAAMSRRKRKRFILKPTIELPRKDRNKHNVIIYEGKSSGIENHQVNSLPFPYTKVKDFEASLRAPIGTTWVPESAHRKLTAPRIVTLQGQVIKPMNEDALLDADANGEN